MRTLVRKNIQQFEKRLGSVSRVVCYVNLLYASRETSQRKNYPWKNGYMPTLSPSTRPNKIFSSLYGTIRIRSLSSFLSSLSVSGLLRILQWAVLPFGSWYKFDQICATLRVNDSWWIFYSLYLPINRR